MDKNGGKGGGARLRCELYIVGAAALWGVIGLFVRALDAAGFSQTQTVALRVTVAAVVLGVIMLIRDRRLFRVRLRDMWCFFGTGVISLLLFNLCYFSAMGFTTLAVASVLLYTAPAFVVALSAPLFGERITVPKLAALAVMGAGCVLVTGLVGAGGQEIPLRGVLLGLGAGLGYALYSIFGRYALNRGYDSMTISFYTFAFAAVGALAVCRPVQVLRLLDAKSALCGVGIGVVCCVLPYLLYTKGLSGTDNGRAAMLATVEPCVATLVSIVLFREPVTLLGGAGMALVLLGILIMNIRPRARNSGGTKPEADPPKTGGTE